MKSPTLERILKSNPLAVLMVIEGLNRYSAQVAESKPEDYPAQSLVAPHAWIELAQDIQKQLKTAGKL